MTQLYLSNSNEWIVVIDPQKSIVDYATFASETDANIFREKDSCEKLYLKGLLKIDTYDINNNNSEELLLNAKKMGYRANAMVGKYLVTACDDKRYEYYETWIELI